MNSEVISSRYAKALLEYAAEAGSGNKVYSQALALAHAMQEVPMLRDIILKHDDVALVKKTDLLSTALGESLADELVKFIELVSRQRRMDKLQSMLLSYIIKFRQKNNIKVGSLMTATPSEDLRERHSVSNRMIFILRKQFQQVSSLFSKSFLNLVCISQRR